MSEKDKKIQVIKSLLEQYTNTTVILKDTLTEAKKLDSVHSVFDFVNHLLRKYKLRIYTRVIMKLNNVKVEEVQSMPTDSLNGVIMELEKRGFKKIRDKKINQKIFNQLIDENTNILVFIPKV